MAWRSPAPDGVLTMTMPGGAEWTSDAHSVFAELSRLDPQRRRDNQSPIIGNFKAAPLMVGGTLFFNAPLSIGVAVERRDRPHEVAVDAMTGRPVPALATPGAWTCVCLPTNTTAPDFDGGDRPGDDLFAESLVCLDVETGKRASHFQAVHHGLWDYDNPAAPNLLDITVNGRGSGRGGDRQAGLRLHVRPRHGRARVAHRGEAGAAVRRALARRLAHAAVSVETGAPRVPGRDDGRSGGLHARAARDSAGGSKRIPDGARSSRHRRWREPSRGPDRWAAPTGRAPRSTPRPACSRCPRATASRPSRWRRPRAEQQPALHAGTGHSPQMPQGLPLLKPACSRVTAIDMNTGEHAWMIPAGAGQRIRNLPQLKGLTRRSAATAMRSPRAGRVADRVSSRSTRPRAVIWHQRTCQGWPSARR